MQGNESIMQRGSHIVFAGGGAAGHLFPGLAVADHLAHEAPHLRITFAGSGKSFERSRVTRDGFEYFALPWRPFPSRARDAFRFLRDNVAGYYASSWFLREQQVALVVGLGGYVSAPVIRAATRRKIPVVLLEQNAVPSLVTRRLAPKAAMICAAFEEVRSTLQAGSRLRITGNPLPRSLTDLIHSEWPSRNSGTLGGSKRLLVSGGSGGARTLNHHVPRALHKVRSQLEGWELVHQTGERDLELTRELYRKLDLKATVTAFISNMPRTLIDTDLAVTRAGGTTLAELAAAGVPALLIPYPRAADDCQRRNAAVFAQAGACRVVDQEDVAGRLDDALARVIADLVANELARQKMVQAMLRLGKLDATASVAKCIMELTPAPHLAGAA